MKRLGQTEQLSLSVRFIKDTKVHEDFLCSVPVSSTTGKDLASTILTQLSQLGLNLEHMRGQGYDGASNMGGKYRGAQARVKELYPLAMCTHCCKHVLNLVISTSSQLPVIKNAMATISDMRIFLSRSAQRVSIFQDRRVTRGGNVILLSKLENGRHIAYFRYVFFLPDDQILNVAAKFHKCKNKRVIKYLAF